MNALRVLGCACLLACSEEKVVAPVVGPAPAVPGELLSDARVAAAGADWQAYVARSKQLAQADAQSITSELQHASGGSWRAAPVGSDFKVTHNLNDAWFASEQARNVADNALTYQTPAGGWSKAVSFAAARSPGQSYSSTDTWSWIGTFDNNATTDELWLLAGVSRTHSDAKYQQAFLRGLTYIFVAQMPNGCWPQVFPLTGSYHDAVTYNDAAIPNILALLGPVSKGTMSFVPASERAQASVASQRGVACIGNTQVRVNGQLTTWGQQHDPLTLAPVQGRAYEPPALTSVESAPVMEVLMSLASPDAQQIAAVHAAARWLDANATYGWRWLSTGVLEPVPGEGPLWARFYEIGTNRPLFSDRDGVVRYDVSTVSEERRTGYAWYSTAPASTLQHYRTWAQTH